MSPGTAVTVPPITATASSSSVLRRQVMNTCAPSATSRAAVARPIPRVPPPVTTAALPSSLGIFDLRIIVHRSVPKSTVADSAPIGAEAVGCRGGQGAGGPAARVRRRSGLAEGHGGLLGAGLRGGEPGRPDRGHGDLPQE